MKTLPDKCVDLVLTDPPYGIGFDNKIRDEKVNKWDSFIPTDDYFYEMLRVSKNQIIR
jgi:site-specific DNA-methyltransferase (adenine-specific)